MIISDANLVNQTQTYCAQKLKVESWKVQWKNGQSNGKMLTIAQIMKSQ